MRSLNWKAFTLQGKKSPIECIFYKLPLIFLFQLIKCKSIACVLSLKFLKEWGGGQNSSNANSCESLKSTTLIFLNAVLFVNYCQKKKLKLEIKLLQQINL